MRRKTTSKPFSIAARLNSFRFAFAGIWTLLKTQHNMRIHLVAAVLAIGCGVYVGLTRIEWCIVILTIMAVWVAEACNTAIEFLADRVSTDHHPLIKNAKDIAAAAVLITAIGAVIIGAIIFLPYML